MNANKDFPYTIFPVKKINVEIFLKIYEKLLFNYSLYSHPEIGKFQGVIRGRLCFKWERMMSPWLLTLF
jgi:hypothetical protein